MQESMYWKARYFKCKNTFKWGKQILEIWNIWMHFYSKDFCITLLLIKKLPYSWDLWSWETIDSFPHFTNSFSSSPIPAYWKSRSAKAPAGLRKLLIPLPTNKQSTELWNFCFCSLFLPDVVGYQQLHMAQPTSFPFKPLWLFMYILLMAFM